MVASNGRIIGLDVGRRRVGVASASPVARIATALQTLDLNDSFFTVLSDIVARESADVIVVGLPIDMQRRETEQTAFVYNFIRDLSAAFPEIQIQTYEETLTSQQAEAELRVRHKTYTKADIDARAAELILQGYLDNSIQTGVENA